jgi:hypothetical protein
VANGHPSGRCRDAVVPGFGRGGSGRWQQTDTVRESVSWSALRLCRRARCGVGERAPVRESLCEIVDGFGRRPSHAVVTRQPLSGALAGSARRLFCSPRASTVAPGAPRPSSQPADSSGLGCRSALRGSVRAPSPNAPRRHAVVVVHERLSTARMSPRWQHRGDAGMPNLAVPTASARGSARCDVAGVSSGGVTVRRWSGRFAEHTVRAGKVVQITVDPRIHGVWRVRGDGDIVSSPPGTIARCGARAVSRLAARVRPRGGSRAPGLVRCRAAARWRHRV